MKYRKINVDLNREYRNDLNWNFQQIHDDIINSEQISNDNKQQLLDELARVEQESIERDDLLAGESLEALLQSIEDAKSNAHNAASNANLKAEYATEQGDYAKEQGDYAKTQGDYAKLKGDYADEKAILADDMASLAQQEASNLDNLKVDVVNATQFANTSATYAEQQGDYAKSEAEDLPQLKADVESATNNANNQAQYAEEQGDYAKAQGQFAENEATNLEQLKTDVTTATNDANEATSNANTSASNADEKAQLADDKADYATEQGDYAKQQGERAENAADTVEGLLVDGAVASINGKTGVVTLDAEDVGAIPSSEKGVAGGVAKLNEEGKVVDALGNEVEGKVTSVNGQVGDVVLTAEDVDAETPQGAQDKANLTEKSVMEYVDTHFDKKSSKNPLKNGRLITDFSDFVYWFGGAEIVNDITTTNSSSHRVYTTETDITSAIRLRNGMLDLSNSKNIIVKFFVEDIGNLSNITFRFSSVDNMSKYLEWRISRWSLVEGWNEISLPFSKYTSNNGQEIDETITTIQASVTSRGSESVASVVFDSIYLNAVMKPSILFHFDDGFVSQYEVAFPILKSKGFVGSVGVVSDYVGTPGYMSLQQLKTLQTYGWEIFNHTKTHTDLTTLTKEEIESEIIGCKNWLDDNGFTESSDIVAYPYGSYNEDVLEVMKNMELGRTVTDCPEISPPVNPYRLKVINLFNDVLVEEAKEIVDEALETGSTIIFLLHKIESSGENSMIWSTENFKQLTDYIADKNISVLTTKEWASYKVYETCTCSSYK